MPEAYIIDAVRSPVGRRGGALAGIHPADLGAHSIRALIERTRGRPRGGRRRRVRLRRHDRPAGGRHRAHVLARRRASRRRSRHDRRPAVRLVAAGRALRRAGRDVGDIRPRRRGRRAEHERDPDQRRDARRRAVRLREPVLGFTGLGGALRHPGGVAVPLGRDDRREVGPLARRHGGVRGRVARSRAARARRGPLRARDRAARTG